ncbi:NAD(P)-binding protein [Myriangium duriaei CBS 260.36]|uniref:NAD(P)-binding protein n=1 Tax=Myriangium duriaei CBS 260.36 TaxID=1168546 RepID=A0A9P4J9V4_9PEZI|nr:NAD(P)-binding protein [Myriangium duriaei CBS 260.36]
MSKAILITGATGNQGGALINTLTSTPNNLQIIAVTRNPESASAQKIASKSSNIKVIKGDLNDVPAIFAAAKEVNSNIWGVYSVQLAQGVAHDVEIAQGNAMIDEALKHGVKQFVYSSVDRGGDKSYDEPTDVPHFMTKYDIEHHLVDATKGTDMRYTILRPVAFMDNLATGFMAKLFISALRTKLPENKPLQYVDVRDIGHFAAQAFLHPETFQDRSLSLAGDELTSAQLDALYQENLGYPTPRTFSVLGYALRFAIKDFGNMINFFAVAGYGADIAALKKEYPGLHSMNDWIKDNKAKL